MDPILLKKIIKVEKEKGTDSQTISGIVETEIKNSILKKIATLKSNIGKETVEPVVEKIDDYNEEEEMITLKKQLEVIEMDTKKSMERIAHLDNEIADVETKLAQAKESDLKNKKKHMDIDNVEEIKAACEQAIKTYSSAFQMDIINLIEESDTHFSAVVVFREAGQYCPLKFTFSAKDRCLIAWDASEALTEEKIKEVKEKCFAKEVPYLLSILRKEILSNLGKVVNYN